MTAMNRVGRLTVACALILCMAGVASAQTTRYVPSQYYTIQAAVNAAHTGDIVEVADGTYTGEGNKNINFGGKDIVVRSENGAGTCTIDCEGEGRGFHFQSGESAAAVVDGFTIVNGSFGSGAAFKCWLESSPTIMNCVMVDCDASYEAGGVYAFQADPTVINCLIVGCTGRWDGGGVFADQSMITLVNCTIVDNTTNGAGGGVRITRTSEATIANCILVNNDATSGPDLSLGSSYDPSTLTIAYSNVLGGETAVHIGGASVLNWGAGMTGDDPTFSDPAGGDYHLLPGSPCIDGGTNSPVTGLPALDLDGESRVVDGDGDVEAWTGVAETVDMGAYEAERQTTPWICVSPNELYFSAELNGSNPADQTLSIRNCGIDTLDWQIVETCSWLSVDPNGGSSTGEVDDVTVSVDITGLAGGEYACVLEVVDPQAANGSVEVPIHLTVDGPLLCVTPDTLSFTADLGGANPAAQTLSLSNCGIDVLTWQVMETCSWLSVDPNSGSASDEVDTIDVSVDIAGLPAGEYACTLEVVSPEAANSPVEVPIVLTIGGPMICTDPNTLVFLADTGGANPAAQVFTVSNCGVDTLYWQVIEECEWLTVSPSSGDSVGEPDDVTVAVDIAGMAEGIYRCDLEVLDSGARSDSKFVQVVLVIGNYLYVPGQYATIQEAIDAADPGDTVIIADGTYTGTGNKDLAFGGKDITVRSLNGPDNCIINCQNNGRGFNFANSETRAARVEGLTILNGWTTSSSVDGADGGGIRCYGASPTIVDCVINGCDARVGQGGGVCCRASSAPLFEGCEITNCKSTSTDYYGAGGGVFGNQSTVEFRDCLISNNVAAVGGGVYWNGTSVFEGCTISDNLANDSWGEMGMGGAAAGGGLRVTANTELRNCTIADNEALGYSWAEGGGVYVTGTVGIDLTGCIISGNTISSFVTAGEVAIACEGPMHLTDCAIAYNSIWPLEAVSGDVFTNTVITNSNGWGIVCGDDVILDGCTITGCADGGVNVEGTSVRVVGCNFVENTGHGLYVSSGGGFEDNVVVNCLFASNTTSESGAGAFISSGVVSFLNSVFVDNQAVGSGDGAAIRAGNGTVVRLLNCVIANNGVEAAGCGAVLSYPTMYGYNCVAWGNDSLHSSYGSDIQFEYSNVQGATSGTGNISVGPLFVDPDGADDDPGTWEDNDYRLQAGSPCVDAGNTATLAGWPDGFDLDGDGDTTERLSVDFDGMLRFADRQGTADTGVADAPDYPYVVDMGAFEYQCMGDLDGDGAINLADLQLLLSGYGDTDATYAGGDLDGSGTVNLADLQLLLSAYGQTCP